MIKSFIFIAFIFPVLLIANEISLEDDFLASLDEVSDIASKSKLNIDDMPAFVTILQGKKLELLGIHNIYEALSLVPGVELSMEASGAKQVIFRGVKEKGKVKLLVDGVAINNSYRGSMYYYLDFPIEMLERIEVIRGPSSILYGSGAISGMISIITKNSKELAQNSIFAEYGSAPFVKGGMQYSYNFENASRLSIDGYYQKDDTRLDKGIDKDGREGRSNESLKDYSIGINYQMGNFTFLARTKNSLSGVYYGVGNNYESEDNDGFRNIATFATLQYKNTISSDMSYEADIGYSSYTQKIDSLFYIAKMNDEAIYDGDYKEYSLFADISLNTRYFENQELIMGARFEHSEATEEKLSLKPIFEDKTVITPDSKRDIFSFFVNDTISASDNIDIVAGMRYDNYSDFGSAFSPRLGAIYRTSSDLNFKLLYSHSFRAPSWIELYATIPGVSIGNKNLDAEKADTLEFGTVYKVSPNNKLRFNFYATMIDNLIVRVDKVYKQEGKSHHKGVELEWIATPNITTEFKASASYTHATDDDGDELPNIANYLANMTLLHDFDLGFNSGSVLRYVSSRQREAGDNRDDLEGYFLFDQTFTYQYNAWTFSASIKNLFDAQYAYPAPAETYTNDYLRRGRTAWISGKLEF